MHANTELLDDVIKLVLVLTTTLAAIFGALNHKRVKSIDKAVNGVKDPSEPTLRENVVAIKDEQKAVRATLEQSPPPGQVGG